MPSVVTHKAEYEVLIGTQNHIAHHIPSIFALGATPATIKRQYEDNASYQLPPKALHQNIVNDMRDFEVFHKYLGKRDHYHDYLAFFQKEIDSKGWQSVLNEQFFSRTERSDDMLVRLLGGECDRTAQNVPVEVRSLTPARPQSSVYPSRLRRRV